MRRIIAVAAAAAASITLAACGSSSSSMSSSAMPGTSASATDHVQADVTFAQNMIAHHTQAIEMADMASTRASNAEVKTLAAKIKAAQGPEITKMSGWLTSWGQPTAMPMDHSMPGMDMSSQDMAGMMSDSDMKMLESSTGAAFDKQFLTMMISHHEGAVSMAKTEQSDGRYGPAKELAASIVTSQSAEITQMKALLKTV